jgi:hypothetical protein
MTNCPYCHKNEPPNHAFTFQDHRNYTFLGWEQVQSKQFHIVMNDEEVYMQLRNIQQ